VIYYLMAKDWGQMPREIEATVSEEEFQRWLALNVAQGEALEKAKGAKAAKQYGPGVTVTELLG